MTRLLIVIPARGGSKGLPNKNLLPVGGLPLVSRAVLGARAFLARHADVTGHIVVDTDSQAIADVGARAGAWIPFLREAHFAADNTTSAASVNRLLERLAASGQEYDALLLLQPTSPLRSAQHIAEGWATWRQSGRSALISVTEAHHHPRKALRLEDQLLVSLFSNEDVNAPRQAYRTIYYPNGAVYFIDRNTFREHLAFIIPSDTASLVMQPGDSVDVDSAGDLHFAESVLLGEGLLTAHSSASSAERDVTTSTCPAFVLSTFDDLATAFASTEARLTLRVPLWMLREAGMPVQSLKRIRECQVEVVTSRSLKSDMWETVLMSGADRIVYE